MHIFMQKSAEIYDLYEKDAISSCMQILIEINFTIIRKHDKNLFLFSRHSIL